MARHESPQKVYAASMAPFAHRKNLDGTWDSVCFGCYKTVATRFDETRLNLPEEKHVCFYRLIQLHGEWPHFVAVSRLNLTTRPLKS